MRNLLFILLLLTQCVLRLDAQIKAMNIPEADSICQSLPEGGITTEVYDVTGVLIGKNVDYSCHSMLRAEFKSDRGTFAIFRLSSFDSIPFKDRNYLHVYDTITIRTRLQNWRGYSCSYYGYLLERRKYVDPIIELTRHNKDKEWQLVMEQEKRRWLLLIISISSALILLLAAISILHAYFFKRRAEYDGLTGIHNRFGGQQLIHQAMRNHVPGYLCILDLDKFRQLNDQHGTCVGDEILIQFAQALKSHFSDHITLRMGGDEFAIYLRHCEESELRDSMESFFKVISEIRNELAPEFRISVSVGATYVDCHSTKDLDHLLTLADQGCYESKRTEGSCLSLRR